MENDKEYCLEVWGDWACFTRPDLKVERVSYDVITPSAARSIFEAILMVPYAITWEVTKIEVMNPIKWMNIRRNEVGATASPSTNCIFIDKTDDKGSPINRQQRNSLILRDVRYRIYAKLVYNPVGKRPPEAFKKHQPRKDENPMKYYQMFERRASQGQCFTQPYLGCREFAASWRFIENTENLDPPQGGNCKLGFMLYDRDYDKNPLDPLSMFYRAEMKDGVIIVPPKKVIKNDTTGFV